MSFFGDAVEKMKKGIGWKDGSSGFNHYKNLAAPGPYDFGTGPTTLSKRAWRRLPHSSRKSVINESRTTALGG